MFGIFSSKRVDVARWEKDMLIAVFDKLPGKQFIKYSEQVRKGILHKVSFIQRKKFVAFNYTRGSITGEYLNEALGYIRIAGLRVFDKKASGPIDVVIHVAVGLVAGYTADVDNLSKLEVERFEIGELTVVASEYPIPPKLNKKLTPGEKKLLKKIDLYEVEVNGKIYYHLSDLEDGDFIGIDDAAIIYEVTHDPLGARVLDKSIGEILKPADD